MRGKLARKLRRKVYGEGYTGKLDREERMYHVHTNPNGNKTLLSFELRREYQDLKKFLS